MPLNSVLKTESRLSDPDAVFEALVHAHAGLDATAARALDARLILLLANHIGDDDAVLAAIEAARADLDDA